MKYKITDNCIGCGLCEAACPALAIEEVGEIYKITDRCEKCGICISECPTNAIIEE